jgi:hypothetical protein
MTEAEAIKFLQRRGRGMVSSRPILVPEIISRIRSGSISMISSGSLLILLASIGSNHAAGYRALLKVIELVIGLCMLGYAASSLIRLRAACRALDHTTDGSSRLSGSR